MTAAELEARLLRFVNERLIQPDSGVVVEPDTPLFESRVVNSMRILDLLAFLEATTGREVPDRQVRLANFRSVRVIAGTFAVEAEAVDPEAEHGDRAWPLFRHAARRAGSSPIEELRRRGEVVEGKGGEVEVRGRCRELLELFDDVAREWATELGASERRYPAAVPLSVLETAGYLEAFPSRVLRDEEAGQAHLPGACFPVYAELAGKTLPPTSVVLTVRARCGREEEAPLEPLERQRRFEMREIVVLGSEDEVEAVRRRVIVRAHHLVQELDLEGRLERATDPFFTRAARGRALMQRLLPLKYELMLEIEPGRSVAAASFNHHGEFFGRRFAIRTPSGATASSGCAAFGLERWVLAFLARHGHSPARWPATIRRRLAPEHAQADDGRPA